MLIRWMRAVIHVFSTPQHDVILLLFFLSPSCVIVGYGYADPFYFLTRIYTKKKGKEKRTAAFTSSLVLAAIFIFFFVVVAARDLCLRDEKKRNRLWRKKLYVRGEAISYLCMSHYWCWISLQALKKKENVILFSYFPYLAANTYAHICVHTFILLHFSNGSHTNVQKFNLQIWQTRSTKVID